MTEQEITDALRQMRKIGHDRSGWQTLYQDGSGKLWEVTYPHSERHGGGPRELRRISRPDAVATYGTAVPDA
jgi:hypothetical protein